MTEELDLLGLLIDKIEYQIITNKDNIKACKKDIKKLEKSKADVIEAGIDDFIFDDNINRIMKVRENLVNRVEVLKKVKYRLVVSERMLKSVK